MFCRYLSGWGYLLSQDAVQLIVSRVEMYEQEPATAPGWFAPLHWEDVLVGLLLHGYAQPQTKDDSECHFSASSIKHVHVSVTLLLVCCICPACCKLKMTVSAISASFQALHVYTRL